MTRNKHLNTTVRNRMASTGLSYTRARAEISRQLDHVAEFRHLPIVWDVMNDSRRRYTRPTERDHRAALGAIALAMRDMEILYGATQRDQWRTIDGHIDMDWVGGPYAHEVVRALLALAEEPDVPPLHPGELRPGMSRLGDLDAVWIYGVRVRFRPFRPLGAKDNSV